MKTIRKTIAALMILLLMISALPVRTKAETSEGSESTASDGSVPSEGDDKLGEASDPVDIPEGEKDSGTEVVPENTPEEASDHETEDPVQPEEIKEGPDVEAAEKADSAVSEKIEDETAVTEGTEEAKDDVPQTDDGQISENEDIGEVEGGYPSVEGEDGEREGDKTEPQDKEKSEVYSLTLVLCDIRDDVKVFRNGERAGWIYGNPSPEDGSFYIAGKKGPEELRKESDGTTRVTFEALSGDVFLIETIRPSYAVVRFTNADEIREFDTDKLCDFTVEIDADTWVLMDAEYSETADRTNMPAKKKALLRSDPSAPVLPDSIYVVLGDKYDDYSGSAMINGHTGVWYFDPDDPEGLYVSAACGNTSKKMVTGTHYKVARISEEAAREYLDYGDGCCPARTQRALAWITHHGQTEYDWRLNKEGAGEMGDGKISVSSQLEAYTITFLASWVCTNDGREGPYGTVHSEDGAVALDAMFGSEFSTNLPASTKNAIDDMVRMGFAFADKFTDGDDPEIDEYMETFIYSDGDAVHQPLLIGAYRGHSHGYLKVRKTSSVPSITDGNGCYSFTGTVFRVTDKEGTEVGTLTSDEKGVTEVLELELGTYTVTEVSAANGYVRNITANTVEVVSYETAETVFENSPVFDPAGMHLAKWDPDSDSFVPQGKGTFQGAEYRVEYFSNYSWSGQPERSWVFRTDENGSIRYMPSYKVSGDELYEVMGAYVFPLGSIRITEVKAPSGYLMSTDVLYATIERSGDIARWTWTTETLGLIKATSDGTGVPEKVIKGGVAIRKADAETGKSVPQGNASLSGAEYTVYAAEDMLIDGKQYRSGDPVLTIVTGTDGIARSAQRALPYGSYFIKETKAPEGYLIDDDSRSFQISQDGVTVDLTGDADVSKDAPIRGGVAIRKADAITGQSVPSGEGTLAGAEYTVYTANEMYIGEKKFSAGEAVLTMTTGSDGIATTPAYALIYGSYYIMETKAPEGYLLDEERHDFRIERNGVIADLTSGNDVSLEMPVRGGVRVGKADALSGLTIPQGDAMLSDAEFTIYAAADMYIEGKTYSADDPVLTMVTNEKGIAETSSTALPYGHYYLKETKAPEGYLINEEQKDFRIQTDGTIVDLTSDSDLIKETPVRGGAKFRKVDSVTGGEPQGCGTLEGAEITIYNSSERSVFIEGKEIATGEAACVIITDEDGYAGTEDMILPYGTYTAKETKPSEGYLLNEDWSETFRIRENGQTVDLTTDDSQLMEQIIRGDLTLLKLDVDGTPISNVPFMIEALDEEGNVMERHVMVTDGKGRLDTAASLRKHTYMTNSMDAYTDGAVFTDSSMLDPNAGVWFGVGEPDDSLGALPYGAYRVYELKSEETAEMQINLLKSGIEILNGEHLLIDFGAMVDLSVSLESDASCTDTGLDIMPEAETVHVTDTVRYRNLTAGRTYTLETRFVLCSDIMTEIGSVSTDFIPDKGEYGKTTSSGYVTANAALDTGGYSGETVVAFDKLYEYVDGKKVLIASHEDPDDTRQMLRIPAIATMAMDTGTRDNVGAVSEISGITDTVSFMNLRKGELFRLCAVLADQKTGEPLEDGDGNIITTERYFICGTEKGEITMPEIKVDAKELQGGSAVVQEKLYLVNEKEEILMSSHEDLLDKDQTVTYPQIRTTALGRDTGEHTVPISGQTVIDDNVILKGLIPGKEYTLKGRLVYREDHFDDLSLFHEAGEIISEQELTFTAEDEEQEMVLSFEADSRQLEGTCAVAFEDLFHNGVRVASHADLNDEEQTVWFPLVITWASDVQSGTQFVTKGGDTVLRDTVQLTGLVPGLRYMLRGRIYDRYTREPMFSEGKSGVFTADSVNMKAIVDIPADTSGMDSFTAVMTEKLYLVKDDGSEILLASHEDIFDEDQALYLPSIGTKATDSVSGSHEGQAREKMIIIDEVRYSDLMPLEKYVLYGTLMNDVTGEPLMINGQTVTAEAEICPEYPDGTVFMTFELDSRDLAGQKLVVFEKIVWNGHVIASHQDLTDEGQSISIIEIKTYAKDPDTNTKYLSLDTGVRITDTVRYTGLTPGNTYTLRGFLMYADDGVAVSQNGYPVTAETEFIPDSTDGEAEVEFILDTITVPGQRLVVFERLYAGSSAQNPEGDTSPIAVHEDLSDEDQTVFVPDIPEEPVDTGEKAPIGADIALAMASAAGIWWIMTDKKRSIRREEKKRLKELTKKL